VLIVLYSSNRLNISTNVPIFVLEGKRSMKEENQRFGTQKNSLLIGERVLIFDACSFFSMPAVNWMMTLYLFFNRKSKTQRYRIHYLLFAFIFFHSSCLPRLRGHRISDARRAKSGDRLTRFDSFIHSRDTF